MWIRSQNRHVLADIKEICLKEVDNNIQTENGNEHYFIGYASPMMSNGEWWYLGDYKTKEKAMSVLDDLQCRIAKTESGVFQMPEDEK